jgi:hypothetical protein
LTFKDWIFLSKDQAAMKLIKVNAFASVGNARNPQILFEEHKGISYRVSCSYVDLLCNYIKKNDRKRIDIEISKISVFGDYWLSSAKDGEKFVVEEKQQEVKYQEIKSNFLVRFLVCVSGFLFYFYFSYRN